MPTHLIADNMTKKMTAEFQAWVNDPATAPTEVEMEAEIKAGLKIMQVYDPRMALTILLYWDLKYNGGRGLGYMRIQPGDYLQGLLRQADRALKDFE